MDQKVHFSADKRTRCRDCPHLSTREVVCTTQGPIITLKLRSRHRDCALTTSLARSETSKSRVLETDFGCMSIRDNVLERLNANVV